MSPSVSAPKSRVFFFSHPRTASNLLVKLLSGQEGWSYDEYHFMDAFLYARTHFNDGDAVSEDTWAEYSRLVTSAYNKLEDFLSTASQEQTHAFTKDHALMLLRPELLFPGVKFPSPLQNPISLPSSEPHTNPTFLPDSLLSTFVPVFSIRHPALVFESWLRVQQDQTYPQTSIATSLLPQLKVYEWYKTHTSLEPIVVDADDVIEDPAIVGKLCEMLGMDPSCVKRDWEEMDAKKLQAMSDRNKMFLSTMIASKGVLKGKSSRGLDLGVKKQEWKVEFGEKGAEWLVGRVEEAMDDYEFLRGLRVA